MAVYGDQLLAFSEQFRFVLLNETGSRGRI